MKVKDLIVAAQKCDPEARIELIWEEELECDPDMWDDDTHEPTGRATKLYEADLHSHEFYLLAIVKES